METKNKNNVEMFFKNISTSKKKSASKRNRAFTLVELIIVITILAILATIGFMSFQGYTTDARDGKRKIELGQLRDGLEMYQIKKSKLPNPDEKIVTVYSGTTANTIAIQGYIGTEVQKTLKITSELKDDETENIYYTYSVNANKTKYQLLAMLENQENLAYSPLRHSGEGLGVRATYARMNYESRTAFSLGNYAVFFSGTTNAPIQTISGTGLNLSGNNNQYKAIISGTGTKLFTGSSLPTIIEDLTKSKRASQQEVPVVNTCTSWTYSTGACQPDNTASLTVVTSLPNGCTGGTPLTSTSCTYTAPNLASSCTTVGQILSSSSTYSGCDTSDIIVCSGTATGYILAACNVGTNIAGLTSTSYGKYFQWGNNGGTPSGTITPSTTLVDATSYGPGNYYNSTTFIGGASLASPYDWSSPKNDNLWGNTTNTSTARQGACANGYHIPSQTEWSAIVTAGGWGTNGTNMGTALKLPFAGYRNRSFGVMNNQSTNAYYRSSSPYSTYAYYLLFGASNITPANYGNRAYGFSLRCFKN